MKNKETLEEAAESFFNKMAKEKGFENWNQIIVQQEWEFIESFPIEFAKWQQEQDKNKYSEEEATKLWNWLNDGYIIRKSLPTREELIGWFEQFKNK